MKKMYLIMVLFLGFAIAGSAQDEIQRGGGRLEAYKIAYLTKKLNLTTDEAQRFWPIYNKYVNELRQAKIQNRNLDVIDMEEKVINIRKRYKNEFGEVLRGERVNEFFKADKEFNNTVQKELIERRELNQMRQQNQRSLR